MAGEERASVLEDVPRLRAGLCFWLRRWRDSPLAYVVEMLGDVPTHQQAVILKAFERHPFVAVASGHGIGKTRLMGWLVNWWLDTRGKMAPITGAGGDQLLVTVWKEVSDVCRRKWGWLRDRYELLSGGEMRSVESPEVAKAVLRTARAENDDALQGFHDCMYFIDEGSGVRDGVFEVASGAMGDPGNRGFMVGNPTRTSGYMFRVFHERSFWWCLRFSSEDSLAEETYSYPYVDPLGELRMLECHGRQTRQWVRDMRETYGLASNTYRVRVLGEFANMGADYLVPEKYLENVWVQRPATKKYSRRMGVDPAWTGDDDTGLVVREGDRILHAESWHGSDLVESFDRIRLRFREWRCDEIYIDAIGVGAGIYDMLNHAVWNGRIGYPVTKVIVSGKAPDEGKEACGTLRDWLWWRCRQYFRTRSPVFCGREDEPGFAQLRQELAGPTYRIQRGRIIAESKDEMKKRGLRSPNLADALNTTFYGDSEMFGGGTLPQEEVSRRLGLARKARALDWKVL